MDSATPALTPTRADPSRFDLLWSTIAWVAFGGAAALRLFSQAYGSGTALGYYDEKRLVLILPVTLLTLLGVALLPLWVAPRRLARFFGGLEEDHSEKHLRSPFRWLPAVLLFSLFLLLLLPAAQARLERAFPAVWLIGLFAFLGCFALHFAIPQVPYRIRFLIALTGVACAFEAFTFLPGITNYPFGLSWSESSQLYFSSVFFSKSVFGAWLPLPVIQPSYELLMSLPFVVQGLPIWVHRLWTALLWIGFGLGTAQAFARHFPDLDRAARFLFTGWVFLFLLQVPVYFQLMACVFLVLAGFAGRDRRLRFAAVLFASAWAGISRVNWFPLPGTLAAVIYLLETPMADKRWRYFLQPAAWIGAGTLTAAAVNAVYIGLSRNPIADFSAPFTSNMLWYRLLPSATNPLGVLPQVVLFSFPLAAAILYFVIRNGFSWHLGRLVGLSAALAVFFCGGLVVSAKIGGGNNIHNLDAFLVLLMVIAGYIFCGRFAEDRAPGPPRRPLTGWMVALAAALPVMIVLPFADIHFPARNPHASEAIARVQDLVDQTVAQNGEVLFITERQLLSFNQIDGVKPVPQYEKWFLMEMSMARNQDYMRVFHDDLRDHRYALIVAEPVFQWKLGKDFEFGEENDAWLKWVGQPLLDDYQSVLRLEDFNLEVFVPRP